MRITPVGAEVSTAKYSS